MSPEQAKTFYSALTTHRTMNLPEYREEALMALRTLLCGSTDRSALVWLIECAIDNATGACTTAEEMATAVVDAIEERV